jgi:hypothetical protein
VEGSAVLSTGHRCCGPQDELSSRLSRRAVGPERSGAERDLLFSHSTSNPDGSVTLPFVIPSVAEDLPFPSSVTNAAVLRMNCHPACPGVPWDRSEAEWRDLLFSPSASNPDGNAPHFV